MCLGPMRVIRPPGLWRDKLIFERGMDMKRFTVIVGVVALFVAGICTCVDAAGGSMPNFSLKDPQGGSHSSGTLKAKPTVIIVTAPIEHDSSAQKAWSNALEKAKPAGTNLVMIENVAAQKMFKGTALKEMKKSWAPGQPLLLLEDMSGRVCAAFGVPKKSTWVFVYKKGGSLVYTYKGGASAAEAKTIWGKVK